MGMCWVALFGAPGEELNQELVNPWQRGSVNRVSGEELHQELLL